MKRHRRRGNQRKIIIVSFICLITIMTVGYAAFNTRLNIHVKGNVLDNGITIEELKNKAVTTGDGLYADTAEDGRYIYKGENPDNYIIFNNETWRIMSVENDGTIKIIRNESIGEKPLDEPGTRDSSTSTYCTAASSFGCNAWAATTNLVGTPSEFTLHYPNGNPTTDTTTYSGTVTEAASLNTYLNEEYYNSLTNEAKSYITSHSFNVGTPGNNHDTEDIATDVSQEALYKWNGNIGLMSVTEILRTTTNTTCTSIKAGNSSGNCNTNNWMWSTSNNDWTLSPSVYSDRFYAWYVYANGCVYDYYARSYYGIRPAIYLTSYIKLSGQGTSNKPFVIIYRPHSGGTAN